MPRRPLVDCCQLAARRKFLFHSAHQSRDQGMTPPGTPTVFVIHDDALVRASIQGMLKSVGLRSETFGTPQEFLRSKRPDGPSYLVLHLSLPEFTTLSFHRAFAA